MQPKHSGGWESESKGALCRLKAPEKALALGSQRESPFVPPASLFPGKLVFWQVLCMKTSASPLVILLLLVFLGWGAPVE